MYSFEHADGWAADGLWAWFSARVEVRAAISAVESAGTALASLVDESAWQSDGVRALHELLGDVQARARATCGELAVREGEIEAVGAG